MSNGYVEYGGQRIPIASGQDDAGEAARYSHEKPSRRYSTLHKVMANIAFAGVMATGATATSHVIGEAIVSVPATLSPIGNDVHPGDYAVDYGKTVAKWLGIEEGE